VPVMPVTTTTNADHDGKRPPMIWVDGLWHSYGRDGNYQVRDVSFAVEKGEIFGFLGPNGAGKSTTQKILLGLLPLQQGTAEVAGHDMARPSRQLFEEIGVLFEQPNLYRKLTGLENLRFFRSLYGGTTADPERLLAEFGLADAMRTKAGEYSKGMQQRLCLARSLLNQPAIWFLDEPSSGLDARAAQEMLGLIKAKQAEGTTIFITTHNMHAADALCDRVAFINKGQIVALDTPRNLKLRLGEHLAKVEHRDPRTGAIKETIVRLDAPKDHQRLQRLLAEGAIETIHSQEATLEQVYIALTGEALT